ESLNLNEEVLGLIVFKTSITDPSSHLSSWNQDDQTPCSWKFITCNPVTSRVTELALDGLNLSGKIGKGLEKLQNLKVLSLANNNFTGHINPDLSLLTNLEHLNLSRNTLSDRIPGSLTSSGTIKFLDLSENFISGPVPEELFMNCLSLRLLSLSSNNLEGPIPHTLSNCTTLNHLNLSRNSFSGNPDFASGIWTLTRIRTLDLSRNSFTGSIPNANNMLIGEFPQWIGSLTSLEYLDLSGNRLTGMLPETIKVLYSLTYLSLSDNKLSGNIPNGLFELGFERIDLSRNEFTGSIPVGSSKLFESLESLDLSGNRFTGDIPAEIGLNSKLRYLNLSWNSFETRMPPELGDLQDLTVLDLRNGTFFGSVPNNVCDSGRLGILQLDWNSFTGAIPDQIGNCSSLYLLSMSHNNLNGSIPRSMSQLKKLKILKLEHNQLTGEIPQELGGLNNLLSVNISYNRLQGRLPSSGIFQTLGKSSLEGNLGPCKMNVPKPLYLDPFAYRNEHGRPEEGDQNEEPSKSLKHHRFLSLSVIIAIVAAVTIAIGVLITLLLNISARRRLAFVDNALESCSSSSRSGASLSMGKIVWFDSKSRHDNYCIVNPESFLRKANEIGSGVFGTVYKASVGDDNNLLSIKSLVVSNMTPYVEDFNREISVLGKLKHPNLVSLKGYYWTPKLQLLVTDYVPNGSLQTKLHEPSPSSPPLSWRNRFKILLGTAKGLAYLHHSFRPPIMHHNIKPNNILLDENLNPKISDYGLTRILSKLDKHVMNNRFQSALGYVAPELACQSLRVNEKCDVYGFGVLILEIITGRRPIEYGEDNVLILNEQVKIMLEEGNVLECVDESMGEYPEEEVLPVLKLALVCTSQIPSSRPSMAEVVQILQVIKTPFMFCYSCMDDLQKHKNYAKHIAPFRHNHQTTKNLIGSKKYRRPVQVLKDSSGSDIFKRYRFGKELGRGEFGVTYACQDKENGENVACKKISKSRLRTEIDIEDVRREVEIMRHLPVHPNIVRYKDVFEDKEAIYLVMELCEGGELFDRIVAKGHYTERAAARVTKTIVEVVQLRNLEKRTCKFYDGDVASSSWAIPFCQHQRFKEIVGSPYYMAPEVLRRNYGAEIDIWSAGVILYILLCGVPPFWAGSRWIQNADNVPDIPLGENVRAKIQQFSLMNKFKKKVIRLVAENLPNEQIDGLKKMFHDMDRDNNGALTFEELKDGLTSIGDQPVADPDVQMFMEAADLDHNGMLNCEEFMTIVVHLKKINNEEQLRKAFHHFDKNHNGYIEFDELKECLFDGNMDPHKEKMVHEIIVDADLDKDGRISYQEFSAMMTTGMDWKMASRQYSRAMLNAISMKMFKDHSVSSIT
ncbi:hypothetical protein M8C21_025632, partial [Ambrosia artemisiifolia]